MSLLPAGSVLMVTRSGILSHTFPVAIASVPLTINQDIKAVLPHFAAKPYYLAYALRTVAPEILAMCTKAGTTVASVETASLERVQIPLAPLREQQRIADKLDALLARVDACRERLDRVPALLARFRQAVLSAATNGDLSADWRNQQHANIENWKQVTIADLANVGTGSTPLRSNAAFFANSGTPWVTSASTAEPLISKAAEFVTSAAMSAHRLKVYQPGTLLVAMYGEGKTRGQVSELGIHATINQACAAVQVDSSKALAAFVKLTLRCQYVLMRALAEGGNQPNLNLLKVRGIPVLLPSKVEQAEIVRRVESLFALADALAAKLAVARAQIDRLTPALLAKAFRGELVPQDPNDEPASTLLARIRQSTPAAPTGRRRRAPAAVPAG